MIIDLQSAMNHVYAIIKLSHTENENSKFKM